MPLPRPFASRPEFSSAPKKGCDAGNAKSCRRGGGSPGPADGGNSGAGSASSIGDAGAISPGGDTGVISSGGDVGVISSGGDAGAGQAPDASVLCPPGEARCDAAQLLVCDTDGSTEKDASGKPATGTPLHHQSASVTKFGLNEFDADPRTSVPAGTYWLLVKAESGSELDFRCDFDTDTTWWIVDKLVPAYPCQLFLKYAEK